MLIIVMKGGVPARMSREMMIRGRGERFHCIKLSENVENPVLLNAEIVLNSDHLRIEQKKKQKSEMMNTHI